jgi:hypothetical protein
MVLLVIGISICTPKLFRPIRKEKQGYRAAAQWLRANTDSTAIVAVPDKRISFYAERKELVYENENFPEQVEYIVKTYKGQEKAPSLANPLGKLEYEFVNKTGRRISIVIYKLLE